MELLSKDTKQELLKYRYELHTLDGAFTGYFFHTRNAAEQMQAILWEEIHVAYQIITKKIK